MKSPAFTVESAFVTIQYSLTLFPPQPSNFFIPLLIQLANFHDPHLLWHRHHRHHDRKRESAPNKTEEENYESSSTGGHHVEAYQ